MAKKLGKLAVAMSERQFLGPMPIWEGPTPTKQQLINFFNWCSVKWDNGEAQDYLVAYLKEKKIVSDGIRAIPKKEFNAYQWVGCTAYLLMAGKLFDPEMMDRFNRKIDFLNEKGRAIVPSERKTVVENIEEKLDLGLGLCESLMDEVMVEREFKRESLDSFKARGLTQKAAVVYLPKLSSSIDEMDKAQTGKYPEISEGYESYSKIELRGLTNELVKYRDALKAFVSTNEPKVRKAYTPRTRKPKSPEKQVKSLKYCRKDDKYGTSIDPRKIVGAEELWMFNVAYRKLTVLRATDRGGLSVKGSTVYGFDSTKSITKKLRKPEETLKAAMSGGKLIARQTMDALKVVSYPAKGRVGEDTILLKVF